MLKPLHDYVLLKKVEEERTTANGIILTTNKEKSKFAVVEAIGSKVEQPDYTTGDKVLFREYAGTEIKINDETFVVIKDEDIIAVNR